MTKYPNSSAPSARAAMALTPRYPTMATTYELPNQANDWERL
jgi:hypothetical protein